MISDEVALSPVNRPGEHSIVVVLSFNFRHCGPEAAEDSTETPEEGELWIRSAPEVWQSG